MKNIDMKVTGKKLVITVDLGQKGTLSKSGKSMVIASTEGNVSLESDKDVKIGLNVYKAA